MANSPEGDSSRQPSPARRILRGLWRGWMAFGKALGWIFSHIVLTIIFLGIFTPVGLFMRLFGRDPLKRRWAPETATYWQPRPQAVFSPRRCERMY